MIYKFNKFVMKSLDGKKDHVWNWKDGMQKKHIYEQHPEIWTTKYKENDFLSFKSSAVRLLSF